LQSHPFVLYPDNYRDLKSAYFPNKFISLFHVKSKGFPALPRSRAIFIAWEVENEEKLLVG